MSAAAQIKVDLANEITEGIPGTPLCPPARSIRADEGWEVR